LKVPSSIKGIGEDDNCFLLIWYFWPCLVVFVLSHGYYFNCFPSNWSNTMLSSFPIPAGILVVVECDLRIFYVLVYFHTMSKVIHGNEYYPLSTSIQLLNLTTNVMWVLNCWLLSCRRGLENRRNFLNTNIFIGIVQWRRKCWYVSSNLAFCFWFHQPSCWHFLFHTIACSFFQSSSVFHLPPKLW
jgi:hypothetical protein